jgi:hypothetical protein
MVSALEGPYERELFFIGEGREEKDVRKFCKWFGKDRAALKHGAYTQSPLSRANTYERFCPAGALCESAGIHPRVNVDEKLWC